MSKMNYNLVRQYASDIYRYGRNNDDRITNAIVKFAHEGKKSPTIAELIKKDQFNKSYKQYKNELFEDLARMAPPFETINEFISKAKNAKRNSNSTQNLVLLYGSEFGKSYRKLYPKTLRIRRALVNEGKIQMDHVTPKANFFEKLKFKKFFKPLTKSRHKYLDKKYGKIEQDTINSFKSQGLMD